MSATIHWRQLKDNEKHFNSGTSTSFARLKTALGDELGESDVAILRAMSVAADDDFYAEVADIIERVGRIYIWAEY